MKLHENLLVQFKYNNESFYVLKNEMAKYKDETHKKIVKFNEMTNSEITKLRFSTSLSQKLSKSNENDIEKLNDRVNGLDAYLKAIVDDIE